MSFSLGLRHGFHAKSRRHHVIISYWRDDNPLFVNLFVFPAIFEQQQYHAPEGEQG